MMFNLDTCTTVGTFLNTRSLNREVVICCLQGLMGYCAAHNRLLSFDESPRFDILFEISHVMRSNLSSQASSRALYGACPLRSATGLDFGDAFLVGYFSPWKTTSGFLLPTSPRSRTLPGANR